MCVCVRVVCRERTFSCAHHTTPHKTGNELNCAAVCCLHLRGGHTQSGRRSLRDMKNGTVKLLISRCCVLCVVTKCTATRLLKPHTLTRSVNTKHSTSHKTQRTKHITQHTTHAALEAIRTRSCLQPRRPSLGCYSALQLICSLKKKYTPKEKAPTHYRTHTHTHTNTMMLLLLLNWKRWAAALESILEHDVGLPTAPPLPQAAVESRQHQRPERVVLSGGCC